MVCVKTSHLPSAHRAKRVRAAAALTSQEIQRVRAAINAQRAHTETSLIGGAIFAAAQRESQARSES
jgi:hypothetical protein